MLGILLGNTLIAASLMVAVVVVCRCFRPGPAVAHALWLVILFKLVSPVGLVWQTPLPFDQPAVFEAADQWTGDGLRSLLTGQEMTALATEPTWLSNLPDIGRALVLALWGAGVVLVLGRGVRDALRFAGWARLGEPAPAMLVEEVSQAARLVGVRVPTVRVLPKLRSPVVWCLFRPVLLLPRGLKDELTPQGWRCVLVHELAHLRRKDHWSRWLELAAAALHWWNPVFWLVRRQLRCHAELACDALVTDTLPDARRDYAEALLKVCARSTRSASPALSLAMRGEGKRDFTRRLTMIMAGAGPSRLAAGVKTLVAVLALVSVPAWTLGQNEAEEKLEESASPLAALEPAVHRDRDTGREPASYPLDINLGTTVGAQQESKKGYQAGGGWSGADMMKKGYFGGGPKRNGGGPPWQNFGQAGGSGKGPRWAQDNGKSFDDFRLEFLKKR